VLSRASEAAGRNRWLLPDILADDDVLITSLCELDLLCALAATDEEGTPNPRVMFGNFVGWYSNRTDPLVVELLNDQSQVRRDVFRGDDRQLATALEVLAQRALYRWGGFGPPWDGYEDERITSFLEQHGQNQRRQSC
jgi:hypothetical protein